MLLGFRSASPSPSPSPSPFSFFSAISKLRRFNPKPRRFNSKFLSPVSSSSLPFAFYLIRCIASGRSAMETSDEGRGKAQEDQRSFTNRLAKEHSPYLLQHAHNPVDWFPWGEQAFEKAQMEDKPIFLSVGYSTCHWCHVMEVESFENEEIAKTMNEWFVNIKVDREERPDVDKVYMTYVQATQGGGGWPMSVFLTPELKPMVGGTYFPPDDKYGRPGFKSILRRVKEVWDTKKDAIRQNGEEVVQQLAEATAASASSPKLAQGLPQQAVESCASEVSKSMLVLSMTDSEKFIF